MTREQVEAKLVELTLQGKPLFPFALHHALLRTDEFCDQCGHNVSFVKITYDNGSRFPSKVMKCQCGKLVRLWLHGRFYAQCERCGELPQPAEFKTRNPEHQVFKYKSFICPCGLLQPRRI